jgi:dihydroxy-acid dehydratase
VAPEAYVGGMIALVKENDSVTIDAKQLIQLNVDEVEIAKRRALGKYFKLVGQLLTAR